MGQIPKVGREALADIVFGASSTEIGVVAIGSDSTDTVNSQTTLGNQLFKDSTSTSNVTVAPTSETAVYECSVQVSGGVEVPAGSSVAELGVFTSSPDDRLVYRETRLAKEVASGETVVFSVELDIAP